jgi:lysophospholipid acyltransferase (LPLAT)-like uncharacterized protein
LLGNTWHYSVTGRNDFSPLDSNKKGRIYCFWHSQLLPISYLCRNTGKTAVVSESSDGRKAAAVAQRWGHAIINGSSTRGGPAALRECVRALQQGKSIAITPDGPRGPRETAKPGVAQIALLSGAPVVPLAALPSSAWYLNTWDKFCIPKPFAHIDLRVRDPLDPSLYSNERDQQSSILSAIQKAMEP